MNWPVPQSSSFRVPPESYSLYFVSLKIQTEDNLLGIFRVPAKARNWQNRFLDSWRRANRRFLQTIRKELLIWNTLKTAERRAFQQRAEEQLQRP